MSKRIEREKQTITAMMKIYCRDSHGGNICDDCQRLLEYAYKRLDNCPFQEKKPACNKCSVHCYSDKRGEAVRKVMRYAGPKMLFKHPILAIGHLFDTLRRNEDLTR